MSKEKQLTIRVEETLRHDFNEAAEKRHTPAAQLLRDFMRDYVAETRMLEKGISANDAITPAERRRREDAERFARASVGLEGFTPTGTAQALARRFITGEINIDEAVQLRINDEHARA